MARILDKKLKKVLDMRTDSPEFLASLNALSTFYGKSEEGNCLEARRALRSDLESRSLGLARRFLESFGGIKSQLEAVDVCVEELASQCRTARDTLDDMEKTAGKFMTSSQGLKARRTEVEGCRDLVEGFLDRYQLSEADRQALYDRPIEEHGGEGFFRALTLVHDIRAHSSALLSSHQQSAGLEILDTMASHQEVAFDRLHQWVQDRCRDLNSLENGGGGMGDDADSANVHVLGRALAALRR